MFKQSAKVLKFPFEIDSDIILRVLLLAAPVVGAHNIAASSHWCFTTLPCVAPVGGVS